MPSTRRSRWLAPGSGAVRGLRVFGAGGIVVRNSTMSTMSAETETRTRPPAAHGATGPAGGRPLPAHAHVAVVGAGFAGLGMAIKLREQGIEDFVVLERRDDVGGTWHDNTYPGCQCDVPSHLYSLSFAPNPGWSRTFSLQRSEEHTSELQSHVNLVCRLLLEKKKKKITSTPLTNILYS